uniref:Uncharacterized protein n=1 Tax=Eutreptiella gymnastica TaxID=73025 RepID=A0A7S1J4K9_9EUGL|mmetsp:Transcript_66757/g.118453  ORF Transcript_66757/g.118453 Transcript_66757/m.118453 type:complete len:163 (+) Transcript_66757:595-1083(+)
MCLVLFQLTQIELKELQGCGAGSLLNVTLQIFSFPLSNTLAVQPSILTISAWGVTCSETWPQSRSPHPTSLGQGNGQEGCTWDESGWKPLGYAHMAVSFITLFEPSPGGTAEEIVMPPLLSPRNFQGDSSKTDPGPTWLDTQTPPGHQPDSARPSPLDGTQS